MPFTITKSFEFCAAHHLPELPDGHKCKRPHGHNYVVVVELSAAGLDTTGFVADYGMLDDIRADLQDNFDHRDLNEVCTPLMPYAPNGNRTTAERLANMFYHRWAKMHTQLSAVTVCETPKTSATYRPTMRGE